METRFPRGMITSRPISVGVSLWRTAALFWVYCHASVYLTPWLWMMSKVLLRITFLSLHCLTLLNMTKYPPLELKLTKRLRQNSDCAAFLFFFCSSVFGRSPCEKCSWADVSFSVLNIKQINHRETRKNIADWNVRQINEGRIYIGEIEF